MLTWTHLIRVVVDTNVWVSALLTPAGPPGRVLAALRSARFVLIISEPMIREVAEVLARPRIARKYGVTREEADELVGLLRERGQTAPVTDTIRLCRDPKDDMLIETALNGRADVLVTRDDDLKGEADLVRVLAARGVAVLIVRRFLEALEAAESTSP